MNTLNEEGLKTNKTIVDSIKNKNDIKYFNKTASDEKYLSFGNTEETQINFLPDWNSVIRGSDSVYFPCPTTGWLSIDKIYQENTPIFVNGILVNKINSGSYQLFLSENDEITSHTPFDFTFTACSQFSIENVDNVTIYDVWKYSIIDNDDGIIHIKNRYCPDASRWKYDIYDKHGLKITKVENKKAYNGTTFVCNIQSDEIKNGNSMFLNCTDLVTFKSDLSSLTNGNKMFSGCYSLNSFVTNLDSLTDSREMFYECEDITSFNIDLRSLIDGYYMFFSCSNLTTFKSDLSSLTNGDSMLYNCSNLKTFNADLSSLTKGRYMFSYCYDLTTFTSNLSSLTDGHWMFNDCSGLTSFTYNLSSLIDGNSMFRDCSGLTSFGSDLSSLTNGDSMFYGCSKLTTFTSDLSSLTNGDTMFYRCTKLTTFTSDLSSLTDGYRMFYQCSNLTTFTSDLSSLTNGNGMFYYCKLDAASVEKILTSIPTYSSGSRTLTMRIQSGAAATKFGEITGTTPSSTSAVSVKYKGWTISVNIINV